MVTHPLDQTLQAINLDTLRHGLDRITAGKAIQLSGHGRFF